MASTFAQIETLKQQLTQVTADLDEVKARAWKAKKTLVGAKLRSGFYRASLALRTPGRQYSMWSTGVLTVGPAAAMLVAFVLSVIIGLPGGLIFWIVILTGVVAFAALSAMLSYPGTEALPKLIADERFLAQEVRKDASQLALEVSTLRKQQVAVKAALRELVDEDHLKRVNLLKRGWKAMRDDEWKSYIGEVFTALGAEVEVSADSDGASADYVVTYGDIRIAVIARGSVVAVTNKDVLAAVASKKKSECDRATVITNSRLANSAIGEAQSSGCILIGMKEFPAFVMGSNMELFR
jgi:HJR/Mrr/RecB family endonuclease